MSFAAVMALIAGWEWLRPRLPAPERRWRRRVAVAMFGTVATSILAGAATTPFGLHHFGRLQLYGVVANAVAVPLTSAIIMPAGMAAVALMPFGFEGLALAPMGWGWRRCWPWRGVAAWPGAAVPVPPITAAGLCGIAFGMAWLCLWRSRWRLLGVPVIVAGFAAGLGQRPPDMLVSADARLIALRTGEGLVRQRLPGASNLTRDAWLRLYGRQAAEALPPQRAGTFAGGAVACEAGACAIRPSPAAAVAAVLLRGDRPAEACAGAALVVSAEPVRGWCAARVVDRFSVWRDGAHAVWL
jgi:competence protein ComEC